MPAVRKSRRSVEEGVRTELQQIRAQMAGVRGSLVATSDGLVVAREPAKNTRSLPRRRPAASS